MISSYCVARWRRLIISRRNDDDNNYGDDDDECRRQCLGRERPAFSYRVAQRRRRQQLATTNDLCRTARPRARAHYMWRRVRATMSYHSNDGGDDEDTNVDEQAVCIAPNIDATINYKRQHRHINRYLLNRRRQLSRRGRSRAQRHVTRAIVRMRTSYSVKHRRTTFNWPRQT